LGGTPALKLGWHHGSILSSLAGRGFFIFYSEFLASKYKDIGVNL
jgi:hypothetical protein